MAVGEKRCKDIDDSLQKASVVLVDIEGTTTSIGFVKNTLFPYIRDNLESYLKAHWNDTEFQEDLLLLKEQAKQDEIDKVDGAILIPEDSGDNAMEAVAKNVLWQMDLDRKTKALKQLQGHIMREGYKNGNLKGHVYSDVAPAIKSWTQNGRQVYIYSSGSVEAQKLLFGHSEEGDLLELFAGHFDTGVGPKVESGSYMNIVKKLDCKSEDVVFLTDVPREAKAAQEAGLKAVLVVREGNEPLTEEDHMNFPVIKSFHDFVFEVSAKRKKMSPGDEPPVIVESTANGPVNETSGSSSGDKIKAEAVKETEVANPESFGSGNTESSSDDVEMVDVSNNDAQETNVKTDETETESQSTDMKMAVEDSEIKESDKTDPGEKSELANDDSEISKTEFSGPESKTAEAAGTEKMPPKLCSENAEEGDRGKEPETHETKLKSTKGDVKVEVSEVEIDIKLNDCKADEKEPKREVVSTKADDAEVDIKGIPASGEEAKVDVEEAEETKDTYSGTQNTKTELQVTKNCSGDAESDAGDLEVKSLGAESGSAKVEYGQPKTSSGEAKTDSFDIKAVPCDMKAGSSNEEINLEEIKGTKVVDDTRVAKDLNTEMSQTDMDSTETEEKMETDSSGIENDKDVNADATKDTEKMDADTLALEVKNEVTEVETESSSELEKKDVEEINKMDMESGETAGVKEEGGNTEPSEDSSASKESDIKIESEVTDKTESENALHQVSEKQPASDSSVDFSSSQTENNKYGPGENKLPEIADAEPSKSAAKSDTKLATVDASPEESDTEESSADKMLQDKTQELSNPVENSDSELPVTSNTDTAKEVANTEDIKPLESKSEGEKGGDESKTAEDSTKENGLVSTAENGSNDISNCPDSEQNGEVKGKEQDVKVKKISMDDSENSIKTEDDTATPIAAAASS